MSNGDETEAAAANEDAIAEATTEEPASTLTAKEV